MNCGIADMYCVHLFQRFKYLIFKSIIMKPLIYFIKMYSFLLLLFFTFGCNSEDSVILDNVNDNLENNDSKDLLMPTGNSTQDTENLQAAINNLKSGETIYLGEGTFLIHASLVRQSVYDEVSNYNSVAFNGTFQGSGKDKTIIRSVRGPNGEDFVEWKDPFYDFTPGTFIILGNGYVGFKDMTFEADSEIIGSWYYGTFDGVDYYTTGLASFVYIGSDSYAKGKASTDCINVYFKGSLDSSGKQEVGHLYTPWGGRGSIHNVKSCEFENGLFDMLSFGWQADATINIGGNASEKVTLSNSLFSSIQFYGVNDCKINASNIEIDNAPGFLLFPLDENTLSNIDVNKCDINMDQNSHFGGVDIRNHDIHGDILIDISENGFQSEDSDLHGPIYLEGVKKANINNNKFSGRGVAAIYLGINSSPGHAFIEGNNFSNWKTTDNPDGIPSAHIWLGPYITDSSVIGGNNKVNVFDQPANDKFGNPLPPDSNGNAQTYDESGNIVSKNNTFTGVNIMQIESGQNTKDKRQKPNEKKIRMNRLDRR
jgi:hypothetical protein